MFTQYFLWISDTVGGAVFRFQGTKTSYLAWEINYELLIIIINNNDNNNTSDI